MTLIFRGTKSSSSCNQANHGPDICTQEMPPIIAIGGLKRWDSTGGADWSVGEGNIVTVLLRLDRDVTEWYSGDLLQWSEDRNGPLGEPTVDDTYRSGIQFRPVLENRSEIRDALLDPGCGE